MKSRNRRFALIVVAAGILGLIAYGLRPAPIEADLATIDRGTVRETVDQDGKTRIRERYIVSAPLAGQLQRSSLDPGDSVIAGKTIVASIEPRDPDLLDARAILQAEANVRAAEAKLQQTSPLLEEAIAAEDFSHRELERLRQARDKSPQSVSESQIENAVMGYRMRSAVVRSARHAEDIARFELDQARAALTRSRPQDSAAGAAGPESAVTRQPDAASPLHNPDPDSAASPSSQGDWHFRIPAPISGRVLRVFQESSAVVNAGANLLELGDPEDLEVEIDVLSSDAVKIKPGVPVILEHWGGVKPLNGSVRLVEPAAFTKISTLGVEEQRVYVIVDLLDPPAERTALGDGFRVEARILVAEAPDVVRVPTSALFRSGEDWAVFRIDAGVAHEQRIELGLQNSLLAEVKQGLKEGDVVVTHPGDNISEGVQVIPR